ncbi:MAG: hypothetical protein HY903_16170 [Deltaproteobacteria bacterium]|nr:hypothetical protein [Deltaproteobacteria bacterium]
MKSLSMLSLSIVSLSVACSTPAPGPAQGPRVLNEVPRADFNRLAAELSLPLFWRADAKNPGTLDADELAITWGLDRSAPDTWLNAQGFSAKLYQAYDAVSRRFKTGAEPAADPAEAKRQALLQKELGEGRFTLLDSDLTGLAAADKTLVRNILQAAAEIEDLYLEQTGGATLAAKIPAADTMSRMVFWLNGGPRCSAPTTEKDKDCNVLKERPEEISGLYPAALQVDKEFCKTLAARPDAAALAHQFAAVVDDGKGGLTAKPYTVVYQAQMERIAALLDAAGADFAADEEVALKAYLKAAAQAFRDNDWFKADESWAKMNAVSSKWYLRIGPDETYFEPCAQKAGFHVSFARINPGSLEWQQKLEPVKNDMEKVLAEHAGKPYKARAVSFHLPDFIDVVVNAGDSRSPRGATIGQSLPNWGPVANEGRGRTVVMTNFYTDPDSRAAWRSQVASLLCAGSMKAVSDDQAPELMSTVLHEAAHNLGPAHEYKVDGKTDDQIFTGPLAATMEELKAQTAALFLADWLAGRGIVDHAMVTAAHTYDITWAFGHISRGMVTGEGRPKTYSQLAAIQVGYLIDAGGIVWHKDEPAANGDDVGCFELKPETISRAVDKLTTDVFGIKARGDLKAAEALKQKYVDAPGTFEVLRTVITERWLRSPQASFLYSVRL